MILLRITHPGALLNLKLRMIPLHQVVAQALCYQSRPQDHFHLDGVYFSPYLTQICTLCPTNKYTLITCTYNPDDSTQGGTALQDVAWTAFRLPRRECDLVMFHDPEFESGLALTSIFVRRSAVNFRSLPLLLSGLAKDVLEVASQGVYWLNGVER
jgi:hypothetical protein